jgi:single-strand DNA-binding protein
MAKAKTTTNGTEAPATTPKSNGEGLNSVALVGRLVRDPILRHTASGTPVVGFSIAVAERGEQVSFVAITVWGNQGLACARYLSKGRRVSVAGRITTRDFLATDGTKRTAVTVTASHIQFLDSPKPQGSAGEVA